MIVHYNKTIRISNCYHNLIVSHIIRKSISHRSPISLKLQLHYIKLSNFEYDTSQFSKNRLQDKMRSFYRHDTLLERM